MVRTLATFLLTVGITAPALLDANIETDGKKLRPHQQEFKLDDGTRVTLDVDRELVTTGDKVTATVTAYSDTPKKVTLDLRLMQTHLALGERVEPPSHQIDREKITVDATPQGGKTQVGLVLGKARKKLAQEDRFAIYVGPHGLPSPTKPDADGAADSGDDFWSANIEAGRAASVDVLGWSGNSISMKTSAEGPIVAGQPFVVTVKIKNTTGRKLPSTPSVELASSADTGMGMPEPDTSDVKIEEIDDDAQTPDEPEQIAAGATVVHKFRVTPSKSMPQITLAVSGTAFNDGIGPIVGGARDVVTFHASADKVAIK